jgi:hypothetical protein
MRVFPCQQKARLLTEYHRATESYSAAVSEMSRKQSGATPEEYDRLSKAAEAARDVSRIARERFEQHAKEHRC